MKEEAARGRSGNSQPGTRPTAPVIATQRQGTALEGAVDHKLSCRVLFKRGDKDQSKRQGKGLAEEVMSVKLRRPEHRECAG